MKKIFLFTGFLLLAGCNPLFAQAPSDFPGAVYHAGGLSPLLADKQSSTLQVDSAGQLLISGTISATNPSVGTTGAAVPASATLVGANKSGTLTAPTLDGSSNLNVNCAVGCSGGSFNNNSDNVATSATNGQSAAWTYVFDGATWDRLYGDSTNGAFVNVKTSVLPTGASTAAKQPALGTAGTASTDVISVQGIASMTPITVSDGAGAMNVIVDSGTLTAVTSITNPVTVTDGAGSLNVIVDSGTLTTVTTLTGTTTLTPGTGAANLGKAEDAAAGSGDSGVAVWAVQTTTPADAATDGDYAALQMKNGRLYTNGSSEGAIAAAPPANATYVAGNGSGATGGLLQGLKICDTHAKYDASDNGSITLVTGVSGRKVYICGYILATGGTATNLKLREGSDANCATNAADLTPAYQLVANDKIGISASFWTGLAVSTNAYYVCVNASAGNAHQAEIWYTIQ